MKKELKELLDKMDASNLKGPAISLEDLTKKFWLLKARCDALESFINFSISWSENLSSEQSGEVFEDVFSKALLKVYQNHFQND